MVFLFYSFTLRFLTYNHNPVDTVSVINTLILKLIVRLNVKSIGFPPFGIGFTFICTQHYTWLNIIFITIYQYNSLPNYIGVTGLLCAYMTQPIYQ